MKITFFIGSMGVGGAERVISLLANDYVSRGWEADIIMLRLPDVAQTIDPRVRLINMNGPRNSYVKNATFWLSNIREYLKKERPDRLVPQLGRINALVLTAAFGLGIPVIATEGNHPKHDGRGELMLRYCDLIYRTAHKIVFQTRAEESCFSAPVRRKGVIIPNPVSVEGVERGEDPGFTIITAGRLAPQKNHKMLMDAMELLRRDVPQARCLIYGQGQMKEELERYCKEKNLEDVVKLPGHSFQIHQEVANSSVFVMTSEFEGLSNSLLEAMILGIPCITTDYPGADEAVLDGVTGYVIPRGDAAALADRLKKLYNDPALARRMGDAAKKEMEKCRQENVMKLWREVIEGE